MSYYSMHQVLCRTEAEKRPTGVSGKEGDAIALWESHPGGATNDYIPMAATCNEKKVDDIIVRYLLFQLART